MAQRPGSRRRRGRVRGVGGDRLIYCGMSGRGFGKALGGNAKLGLTTRLASHAAGRLKELAQFADGRLTLDALTRQYIRSRLDYQFICVETSAEAYDLERRRRNGSVFGVKPLLNPA